MIWVAGHTAIDHICRVPVLPLPNSSIHITDRQILYGGGAANIAAGIARLGADCTLVSAVGGDFPGSDYDRWMDELGIKKSFFIVPDAHTATAFLFTSDAGDQVTYFDWGASAIFSHQDAPSLPFVHLATADPDFNTRLANASETVSFDPGQDLHRYSAEQLEAIIARTTILFANHHEVRGMCQTLRMNSSELAARVPIAVFTHGKEGCRICGDGYEEWVPAVPVHMEDPTGAGDSFRAGFLVAYQRGYPPTTCARVGTVTASFVVEKAGCQTNLPGWTQMEERYSRHFGELAQATRGDA